MRYARVLKMLARGVEMAELTVFTKARLVELLTALSNGERMLPLIVSRGQRHCAHPGPVRCRSVRTRYLAFITYVRGKTTYTPIERAIRKPPSLRVG